MTKAMGQVFDEVEVSNPWCDMEMVALISASEILVQSGVVSKRPWERGSPAEGSSSSNYIEQLGYEIQILGQCLFI